MYLFVLHLMVLASVAPWAYLANRTGYKHPRLEPCLWVWCGCLIYTSLKGLWLDLLNIL